MDYTVTITISGYGHDDGNSDRVLEAFLEVAPTSGPVTDVDLASGELAVTFAVDADSPGELQQRVAQIFGDSMARSGLEVSPVVSTEIHPVGMSAAL
jgi:hypothetical protein